MKSTNIYLADSQAEALDRAAEEAGVSRVRLIHWLIDRSISAQPSADLAADLDAIEGSFGVLAGQLSVDSWGGEAEGRPCPQVGLPVPGEAVVGGGGVGVPPDSLQVGAFREPAAAALLVNRVGRLAGLLGRVGVVARAGPPPCRPGGGGAAPPPGSGLSAAGRVPWRRSGPRRSSIAPLAVP
jgi:hypothetical protein